MTLKKSVLYYLGSVLFLFFCLSIVGCARITRAIYPDINADQLARNKGLFKEDVEAGFFSLRTYHTLRDYGKALTVYIEGDGLSWLSKYEISPDPTPADTLVLDLASLDPSANVAYLARPCQYGERAFHAPCSPVYWSSKRFSEEVLQSMNNAIDFLKNKSGASEIHLIGYSGGGAIAALLAAKRQDVATLRTLAGNLDPWAVNEFHKVSPLSDSLDPMKAASKLSLIPQKHWTGDQDAIVPSFAAWNFKKSLGVESCAEVITLKGVGHAQGWENYKEEIFKKPDACRD